MYEDEEDQPSVASELQELWEDGGANCVALAAHRPHLAWPEHCCLRAGRLHRVDLFLSCLTPPASSAPTGQPAQTRSKVRGRKEEEREERREMVMTWST